MDALHREGLPARGASLLHTDGGPDALPAEDMAAGGCGLLGHGAPADGALEDGTHRVVPLPFYEPSNG